MAKGPIREVDGGEIIVVGNRRFIAVGVPGHTRDSTARVHDDISRRAYPTVQPVGYGDDPPAT